MNQRAPAGVNTAPLLRAEQCILGSFRHSKFHHRLRGDFDRSTRLGVAAHARLALLLHQFANAGKRELAVLLHLAQGDLGDYVQEEAGGLAVGIGFVSNSLKEGRFGEGCSCHILRYLYCFDIERKHFLSRRRDSLEKHRDSSRVCHSLQPNASERCIAGDAVAKHLVCASWLSLEAAAFALGSAAESVPTPP